VSLNIAIVGGGLGGLATCNALAKLGFNVDLYERAPALGEVGAGIHVSPQALKALVGSGIEYQSLVSAANQSKGIFTRDLNTGEDIFYGDARNAQARYGLPFVVFHRADLLDVLSRSIPKSRIHLGHELIDAQESASAVTMRFANGATAQADLLIGADGVHSTIRGLIYGKDSPSFTGQMVWRALLPGDAVDAGVLEPSGHIRWVGAGRQFYAYYLRGRSVIAIVTQQESEAWVEEGWSIPGDPDQMRVSFPDPEPRLAQLLTRIDRCSKWGIFLRPPTENWGRGRIQLIGDAAHAMLPNAGQGACQAFEDAVVLANWLAAGEPLPDALLAFQRARIPRVHAVQNRSALNASAKRLRTPEERKAAFGVAGLAAASAMDWIFDYDPARDWRGAGNIPARA
jgi:salicylate hydroxylase